MLEASRWAPASDRSWSPLGTGARRLMGQAHGMKRRLKALKSLSSHAPSGETL